MRVENNLAKIFPLVLVMAPLLVVICAFESQAQDIPSAAEDAREGEEIKGDTRVAEIREVERGFYLSVDTGLNYYLALGADPIFGFMGNYGFVNINEGWLSPGQRIGMRMGYDILNNINLELFVLANFNRGIVSQDAIRAGLLSGDVAHIAPGIGGRFAFVTTQRLFVYGRAGLGVAFWLPPARASKSVTGLLVDDFSMGFHTDFSLGVEYYTLLRHLSVGFEVAAQQLYYPFAFGFQLYPTIKYTF